MEELKMLINNFSINKGNINSLYSQENYCKSLKKFRFKGITYYINPKVSNVIYFKKHDADLGYLQKIIFSKNENYEKNCQKMPGNPLRFIKINNVTHEGFYCINYEMFLKNVNDYFIEKELKYNFSVEKKPCYKYNSILIVKTKTFKKAIAIKAN